MTDVIQKSSCSQCNAELEELPSTPVDARQPCHTCGSLSRAFHVSMSATIKLYPLIKLRHKVQECRKPKLEATYGANLHRDSGRWMNIEMVVDRGRNWYKKIVTDILSGKVTRHVDEPLDQHTGRGSAKVKK